MSLLNPQAVRKLWQFWINSRRSDHAEFLNVDLNIAIAYTVKSQRTFLNIGWTHTGS